jgi:hypothetical protein
MVKGGLLVGGLAGVLKEVPCEKPQEVLCLVSNLPIRSGEWIT